MILWREIAYLIHLLWLRLGFGLFKRTFYIFIRPRGKKKIIGVCLSNNTKADWSQKEFDWFPFYCRKSYFVLFFKYLFVRAFGSDKSSRFLYHRHMPMCLFRFTVIFFYVLMRCFYLFLYFLFLKDGLRVFIGAVGSWYWQGKFIQLFSYFNDSRNPIRFFFLLPNYLIIQ